jgi:hypothetical protein
MKMKLLNLATAKLRMPVNSDPTVFKASGDPRPRVALATKRTLLVVTDERTPYKLSLNEIAITSDGSGAKTQLKKSVVPQTPLTIEIPPTFTQPPRYYRTQVDASGQPRRILKEKAHLVLPQEWSINMASSMLAVLDYRFGFSIKFHDGFQSPPSDREFFQLFQYWQGLGGPPPFNLLVQRESVPGMVNMAVVVASKTTALARSNTVTHRISLPIGSWHTLLFNVLPNYEGQGGQGKVELIVDETSNVWFGDWGYKPGESYYGTGTLRDEDLTTETMGASIGIYRMTQPCKQAISLKGIKFGKT